MRVNQAYLMEAELMDRRKSGWDLRSCTNKLSCFFFILLGFRMLCATALVGQSQFS